MCICLYDVSRTFHLSMFEICSERGRSERMIDLFNDGVDICLQQSTIKGLHEVLFDHIVHISRLTFIVVKYTCVR